MKAGRLIKLIICWSSFAQYDNDIPLFVKYECISRNPSVWSDYSFVEVGTLDNDIPHYGQSSVWNNPSYHFWNTPTTCWQLCSTIFLSFDEAVMYVAVGRYDRHDPIQLTCGFHRFLPPHQLASFLFASFPPTNTRVTRKLWRDPLWGETVSKLDHSGRASVYYIGQR